MTALLLLGPPSAATGLRSAGLEVGAGTAGPRRHTARHYTAIPRGPGDRHYTAGPS